MKLYSEKSVMSIFGIEKNENIWSNFYAYFFDSNNPHNLGNTFFYCLINLIRNKKNIEIYSGEKNVNVYREVALRDNSKGRIDLLLISDDIAIVIENKVFHGLINDLDAYINIIKSYGKKAGVVLTLEPVCIRHELFVNITHFELMDYVCRTIKGLECEKYYRTIIEQFFKNIKKLSGHIHIERIGSIDKNRLLEYGFLPENLKSFYRDVFNDRQFVKALNILFEGVAFERVHSDRQTALYRYVHLKVNNSKVLLNLYYEPLWNSDYRVAYFPSHCKSIFVALEIEDFLNIQLNNPGIGKRIEHEIDIVSHKLYTCLLSCGWWSFACLEIPVSDSVLYNTQTLQRLILQEATPIFEVLIKTRILDILK